MEDHQHHLKKKLIILNLILVSFSFLCIHASKNQRKHNEFTIMSEKGKNDVHGQRKSIQESSNFMHFVDRLETDYRQEYR